MSNQKDGGPAFPRNEDQISNRTDEADYKHYGHDGMTLRDYFAAQSIAALSDTPRGDDDMELVAARAYRLADAMLKARDGRPVESPLVASAPDLLVALKLFVAMYDEGTRRLCGATVLAKLAQAEAAIAKAEGQ